MGISSYKSWFLVLGVIVFISLGFVYLYTQNSDKEVGISESTGIVEVEEEESFVSEYFNFTSSDREITPTLAAEEIEETCTLFGHEVKEGTANSNTICSTEE